MGEVIKKVGTLTLGEFEFEVELNLPSGGSGPNEVHLQTTKFRLAISELDFVQMAKCLLLARKNFDVLKQRNINV